MAATRDRLDEGASRQNLLRIYDRADTIAVVGASARAGKPSHDIPRYLQSQGYRIIPINPRGGEMFGEHVYRSLGEVDVAVDLVEVFRPPAEAEDVAREAIASGAKVLWFQPRTSTEGATRLARDAGMVVITGICMGETHRQLGLGTGP
jgi:predicted CoA-binding protein